MRPAAERWAPRRQLNRLTAQTIELEFERQAASERPGSAEGQTPAQLERRTREQQLLARVLWRAA